jgi:hypothetical protein
MCVITVKVLKQLKIVHVGLSPSFLVLMTIFLPFLPLLQQGTIHIDTSDPNSGFGSYKLRLSFLC